MGCGLDIPYRHVALCPQILESLDHPPPIVHHGGAGTLATASRAGVPQRHLTAAALTDGVEECFSDGLMKFRAEQVAKDIEFAEEGTDVDLSYLTRAFP